MPLISKTAFWTIFKLSPYLSAHLAKHCWSEEVSDDEGFVMHILKHLSLTVCREKWRRVVSEKYFFGGGR